MVLMARPPPLVIPAKAGIQFLQSATSPKKLDPGLRRDDAEMCGIAWRMSPNRKARDVRSAKAATVPRAIDKRAGGTRFEPDDHAAMQHTAARAAIIRRFPLPLGRTGPAC